MTVTTTPATALRGDICPPWCGGEDSGYRDTHPDDRGVWHRSPAVDTWTAAGAENPISVRISGMRFDNGEMQRFPDTIEVLGEANPGWVDGVDLQCSDARRLGKALLLACDLMEGRA